MFRSLKSLQGNDGEQLTWLAKFIVVMELTIVIGAIFISSEMSS